MAPPILMRTKYYADKDGHWVAQKPAEESAGVAIIPDIEPYQSMITGEIIGSRSRHREHLREHNCFEVGNDVKPMLTYYDNPKDVAPQQRHELIKAQVDAMSHDQFRKALKRDIDRVKWNSRED